MKHAAIALAAWMTATAAAPILAAESADSAAAAEIVAGRQALLGEQPAQALQHFLAALGRSPGGDDRIAARVGAGRAALWLEDYALTRRMFQEALPLATTPADRDEIRVGLARSLNGLDRPREAYGIAAELAPRSPAAAVEAARAALALGWAREAAALLAAPTEPVTAERHGAWLAREYARLQEESRFRLRRSAELAFAYAKDNDGLREHGWTLAASFGPRGSGRLAHATYQLGLDLQTLSTDAASARLREAFSGVATRIGDSGRLSGRLGLGQHGDWTYPVGALGFDYRPGDDWGMALGAETAAVRTIAALDRRIAVHTFTLGADHRVGSLATLAGSLYRQDFSDGNARHGAVLRVGSALATVPGTRLSVGARLYGRCFISSREDVVGYFNPQRFREAQLSAVLAQSLPAQWQVRAVLGLGRQHIDGEGANTLSAETQLSGRMAGRLRVQLKAGYGDSAIASSTGPGYRRGYIATALTLPW
ncbi:hypothetical protein RG903_12885 [Thermithiobacillus tepidarius DSM 3134]|uniref:hypothetical protein n=1 Tax=Thermithiobacillus tepidarius TaxID=929 RepID=UPI000412C412|nr:hypothetical protein [Thermithiobacillus tepidarius]